MIAQHPGVDDRQYEIVPSDGPHAIILAHNRPNVAVWVHDVVNQAVNLHAPRQGSGPDLGDGERRHRRVDVDDPSDERDLGRSQLLLDRPGGIAVGSCRARPCERRQHERGVREEDGSGVSAWH